MGKLKIVLYLIDFFKKGLVLLGLKPNTCFIDYTKKTIFTEIYQLLEQKEWDAVITRLEQATGNELHIIIVAISEDDQADFFDEGIKQRPDHYLPYVFSAFNLIHLAWEVRGSGTADTVSEQSYEIFYQYLEQARSKLQYVLKEFNPQCAEPYFGLIQIRMGMGFGDENNWHYFETAKKINPEHLELHNLMVTLMSEKWGGDFQTSLNIGKKTLAETDIGNPLCAVIAVAHIEQWLYFGMMEEYEAERMYFKKIDVRQDILDAYEKFSDGKKITTDEHIEALNIFAFCFYIGGWNEKVKECIERAQFQFVEYPWYYSNQSLRTAIDPAYEVDAILSQLNMVQPLNPAAYSDIDFISTKQRVFKTPIIFPLLVSFTIFVYLAYTYVYIMGTEPSIFEYIKDVSFILFLLCEIGLTALILYNKKQFRTFLNHYPFIENRAVLEKLKPIIRTNMYSTIFAILFLMLGAPMSIIAIFNSSKLIGFIVSIFCVFMILLLRTYNPLEQEMKQIKTTDQSLVTELDSMLYCWIHKLWPNF